MPPRDPLERPILDDVDHERVGELADGESGQPRHDLLEIERLAEQLTRFGEEGHAVLRHLRRRPRRLLLGEKSGALQRDRRLRGEELQDLDPVDREGAGDQVVLDVEQADELCLLDDGQAQDRPRPGADDVLIGAKLRRLGRVGQQHLLPGSPHVGDDRGGQERRGGRGQRVEEPHRGRALLVDQPFRHQDKAAVPGEDDVPLLRPGLLEHDGDELAQQVVEHDLAGDGLRRLDHRQDVEPLGADRERHGGREGPALHQIGVEPVEPLHLAIGAPARVAGTRLAQVQIRDRVKAAAAVKRGRELIGQALDVDEAALAGRPDGLLVEALGVELPAGDARRLGGDQGVTTKRVLGAVVGPELELLQLRGEALRQLLLPRRRGLRMERGQRQREVEVVGGLDRQRQHRGHYLRGALGGLQRLFVAAQEERRHLLDDVVDGQAAAEGRLGDPADGSGLVEGAALQSRGRERLTLQAHDELLLEPNRLIHRVVVAVSGEGGIPPRRLEHLAERISFLEQVPDQPEGAVAGHDQIADLQAGREGLLQDRQAGRDVMPPEGEVAVDVEEHPPALAIVELLVQCHRQL